MSEDTVLAIVNGKEIKSTAVDKFIKNLGNQSTQKVDTPEGRKRILNELIQQELLYADAIDNHYDEDEEFLTRLDETEAEMLKQYAVYKLFKDITVTDEDVENYYKENRTNFFRDSYYRASHILLKDEQTANKVKEEIDNGLLFEQAALKYSLCPSKQKGGDLGFFQKGKMVKEFEDKVFEMELNQISEPVQTKYGYHIIKLTDKKEPGIMPLEIIKDNLKRDLMRAKQNYFYNQKIKELKDKYIIEMKEE